MVNPSVRAYMELEKPRRQLADALSRIDAAYMLYQQALTQLGPHPQHGWDRVKLATREDAVAGAIEEFRVRVGEVGAALSRLELRPPF